LTNFPTGKRTHRNSDTALDLLDLSHHPQAQALDIRPHDLETYDELARTKDTDNDEQ
jgi:hypothetical protein